MQKKKDTERVECEATSSGALLRRGVSKIYDSTGRCAWHYMPRGSQVTWAPNTSNEQQKGGWLRVEVEQQSRTKPVNKTTELRHDGIIGGGARVRTVIVRLSSPGHRHRPGKGHLFVHSQRKKRRQQPALEGFYFFEGGFSCPNFLIFTPVLIINFYSDLA